MEDCAVAEVLGHLVDGDAPHRFVVEDGPAEGEMAAVARELALHFILVVVILLRSARQRGVADRREPVRGRQLALELVRILGEPV